MAASNDRFFSLLGELGQLLGLDAPPITPEQTGCTLKIEDDLLLYLDSVEEDQQLYAHIAIGRPPESADAAFYQVLLSESLYGQKTGGGAFGLDPQNGQLTLFRSFSLKTTTSDEVMEALDHITAAAEHWKTRLQEGIIPSSSRPLAEHQNLRA